jgi:hypothetical protein
MPQSRQAGIDAGWCRGLNFHVTSTDGPAPPFSRRRFGWAWLLLKAARAEQRGDFDKVIALLDEAAEIQPLRAEDRAYRALLLLRSQRLREAQSALAALHKKFQAGADPDRQYLWRWATATLGLMRVNAAQFDREARLAQTIPCRPGLRRRFPLPIPRDDQLSRWPNVRKRTRGNRFSASGAQ